MEVYRLSKLTKTIFGAALVLFSAACQPVRPGPVSTVSPTPSDPPSAAITQAASLTPFPVAPSRTPASTASPTAPVQDTPSPTLAPPRNLGVTVLASGLPQPDDLLLGSDGSIYISDVTDGAVHRLASDGTLTVLVGGLDEPEGMVELADGSFVIAEQGRNRLVHFDPAANRLTPFLNLTNKTAQTGVDGIALDSVSPAAPAILIPDSPNGALLRASLDGKQVRVIAAGFDRPTDAWPEPDGSILVADENAGTIARLRPDGARTVLSRAPLYDDVIADTAGNIYAISITQGAVHWIDPATGADTLLVKGLSSPQGLCFDTSGSLIVTESTRHRVIRIRIRE
jgi:streptogramin lyase